MHTHNYLKSTSLTAKVADSTATAFVFFLSENSVKLEASKGWTFINSLYGTTAGTSIFTEVEKIH